MSDPVAKAERSAAKDARQMPAPDRPSTRSKRKRRKDMWRVQRKWSFFKHWHTVCNGPEADARRIYQRELRGALQALALKYAVRLVDPDGNVVEASGWL
jgi:hypothetical protein